MENKLREKHRCIEWIVDAPNVINCRIKSKAFSYQDRDCNLQFYTGMFGLGRPHLSFKCKDELQWPVTVAITAVFNSEIVRLTTSITKAEQSIWEYIKEYSLLNCRLTFELTFQAEFSNGDKCLQTSSYLSTDVTLESLSEDFSRLLNSGPSHDVEIKCGEHSIKAHKIILSARSEVFKAMLESDMLEGRTGTVQIKDIDVNYIHDFVRYLYTGGMPELNFDKAKVFYEAGDKYAIRSLKLRSTEFLQDNLSPENVFDCFVLAEAHSDDKLKDSIKTYILEKKIYLKTKHWLPFCESFPKMANEVYRLSYASIAEE